MFNATFNNISFISWWSILLVEETGVPGKNNKPVTNSSSITNIKCNICETLQHNLHSCLFFLIAEKRLKSLDLSYLLPNTDQYITYEGSFTQPGCQETVTWIIFNKPTIISEKQVRLNLL